VKEHEIERIPIAEIRVANPRSRSQVKFQLIVSSIKAVGLKRPITVCRRDVDQDGTSYDLVCGQGRLEAYLALGESTIPAIITNYSRPQQYLMSLVENIARRQPSNRSLIREVQVLKSRGYSNEQIAQKLGLERAYIHGVARLIDKGEGTLIAAAEAGKLPISIAIQIASGNDHEVQRALSEAYEKGDLRGARLTAAKRVIAQRILEARQVGRLSVQKRRTTAQSLVQEYEHHIREQKKLIKRATATRDRLLMLTSAMRELMSDDNFVTLLRAENLTDMPEQLVSMLN